MEEILTAAHLFTSQCLIFRSLFKRSFSDGNILWPSWSPESAKNVKQEESLNSILPGLSPRPRYQLVKVPAYSRCTHSMPPRKLFGKAQRDCCLETGCIFFSECGDGFNCSNFVDPESLSSSENSCED
ncbi:phosphoinositide phosphatase SAC4-like [Hibiscus syriacus]|uniref:phosphoinositide phosphatase SAC4-like n=1 Tax=Hibiscus syriacus TaxID=106335 RepID=UPI00192079AB|nr:phosphoinositide phosphatase SAC4-like [Hibiscus syriacus]